MEITQEIQSALQELITTGIGRAATAFSDMLNQEIQIQIPELQVLSGQQMDSCLKTDPQEKFAIIVQSFSGAFDGQGVVGFPLTEAKKLTTILLQTEADLSDGLGTTEKEAIAEIGNLIVNAIGCTISDMTSVEIDCHLPIVSIQNELLDKSLIDQKHYYCLGQAVFNAHGISVKGHVVFIYNYEAIKKYLPRIDIMPSQVIKVLIVDDSILIRQSIKRHFSALSFKNIEIIEGKTGVEGLELFKEHRPQLLIIDLLMPEMDGEELLLSLQKFPLAASQCFIVVLSSNFQRPVQERVSERGAHLFIEKPITQEKLSLIMQQYANTMKMKK